MIPATVNRASTTAIVRQILANVTALKLADKVTPAFGEVRLFDQDSLVEAFRWLRLSEQRVCVVLPLDERLMNEAGGMKLIIKRLLPVALLISDRVIGDWVSALYGNPDMTPPVIGADPLKELVLPIVTGTLFDGLTLINGFTNPKAVMTPAHVSVLTIKDKIQTNLPGRACVMLEVHVTGGTLQANTGPGPTL